MSYCSYLVKRFLKLVTKHAKHIHNQCMYSSADMFTFELIIHFSPTRNIFVKTTLIREHVSAVNPPSHLVTSPCSLLLLLCVFACVSGVSERTRVSPFQTSRRWWWSCRPVNRESPFQDLIDSSGLPVTCGPRWVWHPSKSFTSPAPWWRETASVDVSGRGCLCR